MNQDTTHPLALSSEESVERFRTRVSVGTLIGVMTCLLFAGLLMLVSWLPNRSGNSLAGSTGGGVGAGTGNAVSDGTSSSDDTRGENDHAAEGEMDPSTDVSGGRDGPNSGVAAEAEDSGNADLKIAPEDAIAATGAGTVDSEKSSPLHSFTVPPLEQLQPEPSGDDGVRAAAARSPGMFAGRDAEQRKKLAESEGGSAASESAVEHGLKWLADHQDKDGHWSLNEFHAAGECNGRCSMPGNVSSDAAGTGFGLLPFLGAGYTHQSGKFKKTVKNGLDWLIEDQTKEGTFRHCGAGTLYAHGIASIALCEAWAMTKDPKLKQPAQRSIDYMVKAQHAGGGWRYQPGMAGDTSVTGWQVIALRSAQQGGLRFPKNVMPKVGAFLDSVQSDKKGGGYRYMPNDRMTDAMVAEGLLCRIYTSWNSKRPGLEAGVQYLLSRPPQPGGELYYWYYATQVLHHFGGEPWEEWNPVMRDFLLNSQSTTGHESGSWAPQGGHDGSGGRVYATSLSLLTLEVYYRHKRLF